MVADQRSKFYQGAAYQPSQMPVKQTNPWKFDDHHLRGTKRVGNFPQDPTFQQVLNLASERPAASIQVERPSPTRSVSADESKRPGWMSLLDPSSLRSGIYRRATSDDPNRKVH